MKKKILVSMFCATILSLNGAKKSNALHENSNRCDLSKIELDALKKTGGIVEIAGKGAVYIYNCQNVVSDETIKERLKMLEYATHVSFILENGVFPSSGYPSLPKTVPTAIWIVNKPELPPSLIQIEGPWGIINIAPFLSDNPSPKIIESRFKKEFTRIAIYTFGGMNSSSKNSPVKISRNITELDALKGQNITMDFFQGINRTLKELGLTPKRRMSYRAACYRGLAPAPTNEFQKAIWDKVHAAPKNPMKIEFDPKKGR